MARERSREEVKSDLQKAITDFDWIGSFCGDYINEGDFLETYMALERQLRPEDRLAMEIRRNEWRVPGTRGITTSTPYFNVVLYRKGQEKGQDVFSASDSGTIGIPNNLLYPDQSNNH